LIIGGSLGAQVLNEKLPQALALLSPAERPEIWHQTGDKHFSAAKKNYESMQIDAKLQPFIEDMSEAYNWADMVLCRAGALTVAELCAVGVGAIFIPFPHAVDDHQTANAQFMVNNKAAICIQQKDLTEKLLAETIKHYGQAPDARLAMALAAYQLRKIDVSRRIFDIISESVNK
jgi:UDP-N-acetylglucosamine--N-acetylmuramyl-(pentapeptide) pyrophosphoryl-undecaprenol N-acetylglucosamine transferase